MTALTFILLLPNLKKLSGSKILAAVSFLRVVPYWLGWIGLGVERTGLGTGFIV